MLLDRRIFIETAGLAAAGMLLPARGWGFGSASQVNIGQLVYPQGNWCPRPNALRRLAWEVHKRTVVDTALEPTEVKPVPGMLARNPLVYLSGDRPFPDWSDFQISALSRFIKLGGTMLVDPAYTPDGDATGFQGSVNGLIKKIIPRTKQSDIPSEHVIYRAFYQIARPVGRVVGPPKLTGYNIGNRFAVIRTKHDLGGAWARDNLGNWEFDVHPGGERQRENAFRLGINLVLYTLCLDYKDEKPHRRFSEQRIED